MSNSSTDNNRRYNTRRGDALLTSSTTTHSAVDDEENNEGSDDDENDEEEEDIDRSNAAAAFATSAAAAILNSDTITEGRVIEKTKKRYQQTMDFIARKCISICPDAVEAGVVDTAAVVVKLPISFVNLKIFFGAMGTERSDLTVKSKSSVTGYISAIKYAYRSKGIPIPEEQMSYFKSYTDGYKRVVADKKQKGIMKQHEGKVACSYLLYTKLAKLALFAAEQRSYFSAFVHVFLVLCWNLFSRSISVCELRTHHFSWENDMMVIDLSKVSKTASK